MADGADYISRTHEDLSRGTLTEFCGWEATPIVDDATRGSVPNPYGAGSAPISYGTGSAPISYGTGSAPISYGAGSAPISYGAGLPPISYGAGSPSISHSAGSPPISYSAGASRADAGSGTHHISLARRLCVSEARSPSFLSLRLAIYLA